MNVAPVRFGFLATIKGTYQGDPVMAASKMQTFFAVHPFNQTFPWTLTGHLTERSVDVRRDRAAQVHRNEFTVTLNHNDGAGAMNTHEIYTHLGNLKHALAADPQHTFSVVA